ncbi:MAG: restriction endonuclease [Candidatus Altiarchaeota archaeon]
MIDRLPDILEVDAFDFEKLIEKFINKMGFKVESSKRSPDGDIHLLAKTTNPMGGEVTSLIRAGAYDRKVDVDTIKDLYDDMISHSAVRAAYITTSDFTPEAKDFARGKPMSLINKYEFIEALDREGIKIDPEMFNLLEAHGLTEKRFREEKVFFEFSKSTPEVAEYFAKRRKKKKLGLFGVEDDVSTIVKRYAPIGIFRVAWSKEASAEARSIAETQSEDNIFVNLHNAKLYYITRSRRLSSGEVFERSNVLAEILDLPEEARAHLLYLIRYGDLPHKQLEDKNLSILEKRKIIRIYAAGSNVQGVGPLRSMIDVLVYVMRELSDFLVLFIHGITGSTPSTPERELATREGEEEEKLVGATVVMPHTYGGQYDILKYLATENGHDTKFEEDNVVYPSKSVADLLAVILDADVEPKGVVFMPYTVGSYRDKSTGKITRRDILVSPKFLSHKKAEGKKVQMQAERREFGIPYKIIR